jgi:energy-coupling factor transport system permease protein
MLAFLLFTFLGNLFFGQGRVIFAAGPLMITVDGLTDAAVRTMRIFFMIAGARILAASASPNALLTAFGRILKPLEYVGLPVNAYVSTMSLTLQSLPHVRDECLRLYSEKVQGRNIDGFRDRVKVAAGLLVTFFRESVENPERYFRSTNLDVQ